MKARETRASIFVCDPTREVSSFTERRRGKS